MKFILIVIIALLILNIAFAQQKPNTFNNKDKAQQNNNTGSGKQAINNYTYYTKNNNYNINLSTKENSINATRGFFKKIKDTTSHVPYLKLGSLTSVNSRHPLRFGPEDTQLIEISKVKGQIQINAVIRDSKGDEIARISGNTWEISNTQNVEYNNDGRAFEIRSGKRVIFQIQVIKDTVFCGGMICNGYGYCSYFAPNKPFSSPIKIDNATQRFVLPDNFNLTPIFKYPRFEYLGIREK